MLQRAASLLLRTAQQAGSSAACSTSGRMFAAAAEATPKPPPTGSKSLLDAANGSASSNLLSEAAQARMAQVAAEAAAASAAGEASTSGQAAGGGLLQKLGSALFDLTVVGLLGSAGVAGYYYYRYDTSELQKMVDEKKRTEADELLSSLWVDGMERFIDVRKQMERKVREYTDPTCDKLLPDLPPELRGRVKTVVLDLEDVLVHREWTRAKGWQIFKRPGAQDFILQVAPYFELVVYTDEQNMYADPIINRLDPQRAIPYRLYRQDTQYVGGKHVRDLSKLNRELSQVLLISANPDAWSFQPENAIKLKPWAGEAQDTTLLDLIPMLQMVYLTGVADVRDVVKSYDGEEDVARAFKTRMQQISEQHKQQSKGLFRLR